MARSDETPIASFRSNVFDENVVVEIYPDSLQFGKPGPKLSTGQRIAAGAVTSGFSVIFTGLHKENPQRVVIPIETIDSVELNARGIRAKAVHLSTTGVFPGRGNWKSSVLTLKVSGREIQIPVESSEAERICALIAQLSDSKRSTMKVDHESKRAGRVGTAGTGRAIADELRKLHELRELGFLTESEFSTQKARLLGD